MSAYYHIHDQIKTYIRIFLGLNSLGHPMKVVILSGGLEVWFNFFKKLIPKLRSKQLQKRYEYIRDRLSATI